MGRDHPVQLTLGKPGHVSVVTKLIGGAMASMGAPEGPLKENWIVRLPGIFEESGLKGVECLRTGEPRRAMWRFGGENCAGAMEELSERSGFLGAKEYLEGMAEERARGEFCFFEPQVVVGWKAEG